MCLAIPGQVLAFGDEPMIAKIEVAGVRRNVNIGLLADEPLEVGDWVLIHVGFALSRISEAQAHEQLQLLRSLGEEQLALDEVRGYAFADEGRA
jgi:hydrogenase expression/formation protein HypC